MPLPIGHTAIGIITHDLMSKNQTSFSKWKTLLFIIVLSNLPDIDVLIGLIFQDNGSAFHRGPTHSILFSVGMAFIASNGWKLWNQIPKLNFGICFSLILSHVIGDFFFTKAPVSFFWPFEVNYINEFCGWTDVIDTVLFKAFQDAGIILVCGMLFIIQRFVGESFKTRVTDWGLKSNRVFAKSATTIYRFDKKLPMMKGNKAFSSIPVVSSEGS